MIQRLCGVALVLGSSDGIEGEKLERCEREVAAALEDLGSALARPLAPPLPTPDGATVREELRPAGEPRPRPAAGGVVAGS